MIRILTSEELGALPELKRSMHLDRAFQFSDRLGWDVNVSSNGEEYDEYDSLNPLYLIAENKFGEHDGSMRLLPTVGRVMVNEHFLHLTDGVKICSPFIWECTRFCLSRTANNTVAAKLLAASAYLMKESCIDHYVGVFDQRMERVYRKIGAVPDILGQQSVAGETIGVGLWEFDDKSFIDLCKKAKITSLELEWYFDAWETPGSIGQSNADFFWGAVSIEQAV